MHIISLNIECKFQATAPGATNGCTPAGNWMQDSAEGEASQAWWTPRDPGVHRRDRRRGALDQVVPSTPNLEAWSDQYYGAMKLALHPHGYSWDYASAVKDPGAADTANPSPAYSDSGSRSCHGGSDGSDG